MVKKKLLIYAHYYIPDTASTGQILRDLAEGLLDTFDVTVICVIPSYQGKIENHYQTQRFFHEEINSVKILRIRVPEFTKTNKLSRIKNIVGYFLRAILATFKVGKQEFVLSISQPPILGGLLGVWGKWIKHAKYIYSIHDFNPEQAMAIGYSKNKQILKIMMLLDKFNCKRSDLVITVGRDLVETLHNRFKGKKVPKVAMINNWIDENKIYPIGPENEEMIEYKKRYSLKDRFVIMYSGNIGLYYDLENIIKSIEKFKGAQTPAGQDVVFAFVGAGSMLDVLVAYKQEHCIDNVVFIPYQDEDKLIYSLNAADVHWCVNAKGIKGVSCPSKYYGIAAVAKPILGILESGTEVRNIIEATQGGLCCDPGESEQVCENIQWMIDNAGSENLHKMGMRGYNNLTKNLRKDISIEKYKNNILSC